MSDKKKLPPAGARSKASSYFGLPAPAPTPAASPPAVAAPLVPRRSATTEDIWTIPPGELHRITVHPDAGMFPEMTPEEYERVKADVLANGFLEPVKMTAARVLLEGRHRLRMARELGLPLPAVGVRSDITPAEITALIVSANLYRRHLTADQRAAYVIRLSGEVQTALLGADVATMKREAAATQRAGLKEGESRGVTRNPTGKGRTADRIATAARSTPTSVKAAMKLQREDPAALDAMVEGALTSKQVFAGTRPAKTKKTAKTAKTTPAAPSGSTHDLLKTVAPAPRATLAKVESMILGLFTLMEEHLVPRPVVAQFLTMLAEQVRIGAGMLRL